MIFFFFFFSALGVCFHAISVSCPSDVLLLTYLSLRCPKKVLMSNPKKKIIFGSFYFFLFTSITFLPKKKKKKAGTQKGR